MERAKRATSIVLMCTMLLFTTASVCRAADIVKPSDGITKHSPEVRTSPEQDVSKMGKNKPSSNRWIWWTLGALVVVGIAAAAAGGGGGGGGESGSTGAVTPAGTNTGSATISW
jgi:hypothetical protein